MIWNKKAQTEPIVEYSDGPKEIAAKMAGAKIKRAHKPEPLQPSVQRPPPFAVIKEKLSKQSKMSFFMKLVHVIIKDYKMLIRSRTSSLIFFFGPLFLIFLVCIAFNTSTLHDINIAVFSEAYSPLSESLVSNLSDESYKAQKVSTLEECINLAKLSEYQACVVFPPNMVQDNSAKNVITIYTDESRVNLATAITDKLNAKVTTQSKQLSSGLVGQILGTLDNINKEAEIGKSTVSELTEHNKKGQSNVQSLLSQIENLDFSYSKMSMAPIEAEIADICEDNNLSSCGTMFSDLRAEIKLVFDNYNKMASKMDSLKTQTGSVQEVGHQVKLNLNEEPTKIKEIETSFDNIKSSIGTIKITNIESIVSPLKTNVQTITKNRSYLVYLLPTLLALLIMFVSLLTSAISIIREKQSTAYFRNFITPTNDAIFMLGQYITLISLIILQILIMLVVIAVFVPGISFFIYLWAFLTLILIATVFIFVGMFIGYYYNTSESATVAATSIGVLLLIFSNTVLPLETLTGLMRAIVQYNPYVVGSELMKRLFVFESVSVNSIYALLITAGITILLAFGMHKIKEHLMAK